MEPFIFCRWTKKINNNNILFFTNNNTKSIYRTINKNKWLGKEISIANASERSHLENIEIEVDGIDLLEYKDLTEVKLEQ